MSDLVPAVPEEDDAAALALIRELGPVGLEDIDQSDLKMPRLKVKHQRQLFVNPQTNEEYNELEVILLGMLKQRTLWPPQLGEEGDPPLCRSFDYDLGHPNGDEFPWEDSGLARPKVEAAGAAPCDDCLLKDWGTHPINVKAPWCQEQHVYPLLILGGDGSMTPMIYTVAKSGLTSSRNYESYFYSNKKPMFTVKTRLSLDAARKGGNEYSIPRFERLGQSDINQWRYWADQFTSIKAMLNTPIERDPEPQTVAAPARRGATTRAAGRQTAPPPGDGDLWAGEGDTPEG